jgi:hypothetical protein
MWMQFKQTKRHPPTLPRTTTHLRRGISTISSSNQDPAHSVLWDERVFNVIDKIQPTTQPGGRARRQHITWRATNTTNGQESSGQRWCVFLKQHVGEPTWPFTACIRPSIRSSPYQFAPPSPHPAHRGGLPWKFAAESFWLTAGAACSHPARH